VVLSPVMRSPPASQYQGIFVTPRPFDFHNTLCFRAWPSRRRPVGDDRLGLCEFDLPPRPAGCTHSRSVLRSLTGSRCSFFFARPHSRRLGGIHRPLSPSEFSPRSKSSTSMEGVCLRIEAPVALSCSRPVVCFSPASHLRISPHFFPQCIS